MEMERICSIFGAIWQLDAYHRDLDRHDVHDAAGLIRNNLMQYGS